MQIAQHHRWEYCRLRIRHAWHPSRRQKNYPNPMKSKRP